MNKINVLLDTSPLTTGSSIRGIGMYTRLLKQAMEKRDDINLIPIESHNDMRSIRRTLPRLDPKQTIIHYPFFDLFFSTLPLFRSFRTVVTIHDVIPLRFPQHYKPGRKGQFRFYKQAFAAQRVEAVITDSQASRADLTQYLKISDEKLHVVYLAASPELQRQPDAFIQQVREAYKLPQKYVLYVGDINYNKNIPQLIKMVKYIPEDVSLVCVGRNFREQDIPEWKWITTQLALSDVANRVQFLTTVEAKDMQILAAIYSGAEAYIQPSYFEGFGLPVLEAMQTNCPVVVANTSSLIEVAGTHAQLVMPEAEAFAEGVKEILSWTKTHRKEVTQAAYDWSQTFSWDRVADETVSVYRKVLEHR